MSFTKAELSATLTAFLALPAHTQWVEFKQSNQDYDLDTLGQYFSALSNEAHLRGQEYGWLVFGVRDKPRPRQIVGSDFRSQRGGLDRLKQEIARRTSNGLTFEEIYQLRTPEGRVVMFQIPAALPGIPTAWKGRWYGRDGELLGPLRAQEVEHIWYQNHGDWSAAVCSGATLADLDPAAIAFARQQHRIKNPTRAAELDRWDDATFLNKARLCVGGRVTRTAIILVGKEESESLLSPGVARITWILEDSSGVERDYQHFGPPLLLNVEAACARIRNLGYRDMPSARLFPTEITKYEPWVIREALHNAIAHQDYTRGGRINVVEDDESIVITNLGEFLPRTIKRVIERGVPQEKYRNPLLSAAMVNLNMIDAIGGGIRRMFDEQRKRFFPLPDFDLSEPNRVRVRILGKILDEGYTRTLMIEPALGLADVIALDKVQKNMPITREEVHSLKARNLIEGRRPNLYFSARVAEATGTRAEYLRKRAFERDHYKKLVIDFLEQRGAASRADLEGLLLDKVSEALAPNQKQILITNLLQEMRREGSIRSEGRRRWARWVIAK